MAGSSEVVGVVEMPSASHVHVALGSRGIPRSAMVEVGEEVDALGFGGLWVTESSGRDAFSVLTELALRTRSAALGTGIVNNYGRTPSTLAMAAASLAEAAPGRTVNLGIGASSRTVVEGFHGIPFEAPAARMVETLQIIREALSGEKMRHRGDYFELDGRFRLEVPGVGEMIKVFVSALSPRMIDVVRENADGWLGIWPSKTKFGPLRKELTGTAGDRAQPPTIAAYIYTYVGDPDLGRPLLRSSLARYVAASGIAYTRLFRSYGYESEVDEILDAWSVGDRGRTSMAATNEMLDDFCLVGDPASVADEISTFRRVGVQVPILRFPDGLSAEAMVDMLRGVAGSLAQRSGGQDG